MSINRLGTTDLAFLSQVDELGRIGLTQKAVAQELGIPLETLRTRILRTGLRLAPACRVIDTRTGKTLPELLASGELVAEPAGEEVAA